MPNLIGLQELRTHFAKYAKKVQAGQTFTVLKRDQPMFKLVPLDKSDDCQALIDFRKVKKGGVMMKEILRRK